MNKGKKKKNNLKTQLLCVIYFGQLKKEFDKEVGRKDVSVYSTWRFYPVLVLPPSVMLCTQQAVDRWGEKMAVQGVEAQVVLVVWVVLPDPVQQDHKPHRVFQTDRQRAVFGQQKIHAGGGKEVSGQREQRKGGSGEGRKRRGKKGDGIVDIGLHRKVEQQGFSLG